MQFQAIMHELSSIVNFLKQVYICMSLCLDFCSGNLLSYFPSKKQGNCHHSHKSSFNALGLSSLYKLIQSLRLLYVAPFIHTSTPLLLALITCFKVPEPMCFCGLHVYPSCIKSEICFPFWWGIVLVGAPHLRDIFYRMGLSDQDIVALSGGHTLVHLFSFSCNLWCSFV